MANTSKKVARIRVMHRRMGLVVAVFLVFLATTGVLLNHTEDLGLVHKPLSADLAAMVYDVNTRVEINAWPIEGQWLYVNGDTLYLENNAVDYAGGELVGAALIEGQIMAMSNHELMIIDRDGQLIERVAVATNKPGGVIAVARSGDNLVLRLDDGLQRFDPVELSFSAWTDAKISLQWSSPQALPDYLGTNLTGGTPEFNVERLILDLHSGRIFGSWRQLTMDFLALLIFALVFGGILMAHLRKE